MDNIYIADDIRYIGVDDMDLDLFEGQYPIPDGVTYNSYFIDDEKLVVMDTVDACKTIVWVDKLKAELKGRKPDYLVVTHMEPDHAANVKLLLDMFPDCVAVCSPKAVPMLRRFFETDYGRRVKIVKEGDELRTGRRCLKFYMAPMVHWPEVMVCYETTGGILFSADAFGKFGSTMSVDGWDDEARRYYTNICGKYGAPVQALLAKAATLKIDMICPLHGPIIREDIGHYVGLYDRWSRYVPEVEGVFIAYCSLHGNTEAAALKLQEILHSQNAGVPIKLCDLSRTHVSYAVADAFKYSRIVFAAPTYDAGLMPQMDDFIRHLQSKAFQNRRYAVVENGTWAPVAGKKMREALDSMKAMKFVMPMVTVESTVKASTVEDLKVLAVNILDGMKL